jgi:hypothetical protein
MNKHEVIAATLTGYESGLLRNAESALIALGIVDGFRDDERDEGTRLLKDIRLTLEAYDKL